MECGESYKESLYCRPQTKTAKMRVVKRDVIHTVLRHFCIACFKISLL